MLVTETVYSYNVLLKQSIVFSFFIEVTGGGSTYYRNCFVGYQGTCQSYDYNNVSFHYLEFQEVIIMYTSVFIPIIFIKIPGKGCPMFLFWRQLQLRRELHVLSKSNQVHTDTR